VAEAQPHPRDVYDYAHGEAVEGAFLHAFARGRLHHAWLLCGPEGMGKATFAYRAARRLLGAKPDPERGLLGASPDDPESRLIAARSHPDLMVLERQVEDGRLKRNISVDDARQLPEFFAKAPSRAAFRVAIVDAADDMNINAANALLKTLEEPPERGVLFLVAHAPGRLMPTIRSRCRRLALRPWEDAAVVEFLQARTPLGDAGLTAVAAMAKGAPGRALTLASGPALELDETAKALVEGDAPPEAALLALADTFRGQEGQGRFELFFERLGEAIRASVTGPAPPPSVDAWAGLWSRVVEAPGEAEAINLDRSDVFWSTLGELKALRARA
jgi:DNA polymerase-3 subunit delta'